MDFIFKVILQQSRTRPSLIYYLEGLNYLRQSKNVVDYTGHITGGNKKDAKFVADIFFGPMNELDPENKLVDLVHDG